MSDDRDDRKPSDDAGVPDDPHAGGPRFGDLRPGDSHSGGAGSNGSDGPNGGDGLSDDQIDAAFAAFEDEFKDMGADLPDLPRPGGENDGDRDAAVRSQGDGSADDAAAGSADGADDVAGSFEDELAGLVGDKAKAALVITTLRSAELLAAFCALADVSALCVDGPTGACAVLRNLDGEGPESAARDLTIVVSGLSLVLAVNRASKLEAHMWLQGKSSEESFPPPVLFMSTPGWAEDYLIGSIDEDTVRAQNAGAIDSGSIDRQRALDIIARHTKRGRGPRGDVIE